MTTRHRRSIYIEDELYEHLERSAAASGRSTNAEVCFVLRSHYLGAPAKKPKGGVRANRRTVKEPTREAIALVERLHVLVVENGRPEHLVNVKPWFNVARLLLERDKRPFAEAMEILEWSQQSDFWRANVLSMDTFRRQYDALRLQRAREPARIQSNMLARTKGIEGGIRSWAQTAAHRLHKPVEEVEAVIRRLIGERDQPNAKVVGMPSMDELASELGLRRWVA